MDYHKQSLGSMATHIPESLLNDSMEVDSIIHSTVVPSTASTDDISSSMLQNVMEHDVVAFSTTTGQTPMPGTSMRPSPYGQLQEGLHYSTSLSSAEPHPPSTGGLGSQTVESLGIDSTSTHALRFEYPLDEHDTPTKTKTKKAPPTVYREQDRFVPINNTGRVMRNAVPRNAKISKDAKQCMQECISEFISFLTSEASDRCIDEKKKTITGDDILYALSTLGFDNYVEPLHMYLKKYREFIRNDKPDKDEVNGCHGNEDDQLLSMTTQSDSTHTQHHQGGPVEQQLDMTTHDALHMLVDQLPSTSSNTVINPP